MTHDGRRALGVATLTAAFAVMTFLAPSASAHDPVQASELETLLLQDEASDTILFTGGADVTDLYIGEAHEQSLGEESQGDGIYLHTDIYLDPTYSLTKPGWTVVFEFDGPNGHIRRSITSLDGVTWDGDFDLLAVRAEPEVVRIDRAFLANANSGLARGDELSNFVVTAYHGADQSDRAPGGIFLPVAGALVEIPEGASVVKQATYVMHAPSHYLDVTGEADGEGWTLHVKSGLKTGTQHVFFAPGPLVSLGTTPSVDADGGEHEAEDGDDGEDGGGNEDADVVAASQVLGPDDEWTIHFTARTDIGIAEAQLFTDIGGRTEVEVKALQGGEVLEIAEEALATRTVEAKDAKSPAPMLALLAVGLVAAAAARRRAEA